MGSTPASHGATTPKSEPHDAPLALHIRGICKAFNGVPALNEVNLEVRVGEVHVLLGENGAGKSTLMKILAGAHQRDAGDIEMAGRAVSLHTPRDARNAGIAIIYQELSLVPELSVAENIYLGRALTKYGFIDHHAMVQGAQHILTQLGATFSAAQRVASLGIAQRQLVEIARALSLDARLLIMDEPTSALTDRETRTLFTTIRTLTARGVAVIYISHRLDEIFEIGDRVTVLRDGRHIGTQDVRTADRVAVVRLMANRDVIEQVPASSRPLGAARLRVQGLTRTGVLHDINFTVHAGEVLGFAGLLGSGRTELARAICGLDERNAGTIFIDGQPLKLQSARDAISAGIGFVTEDRQRQGLVLGQSIRHNIALPIQSRLARFGVVRSATERRTATDAIANIRIRATSTEQRVQQLSGGNQQKVVIAKWLAAGVRLLVLDEPTRGIDVGARQEIYEQVHRLAEQGVAIMVISSDLPEVLSLADRVMVMREGRIAGEFTRDTATAERIMACAVGA